MHSRTRLFQAADESTCKPDPVPVACAPGDGHPSRPTVAGRLQRSTRRLGRAALDRLREPDRSPTLLDLAPGGVCRAAPVTRNAGGLLHRRFTLTGDWPKPAPAVCFLWHFPAGRPGLPLATTLPCGVRTFLGAARPSEEGQSTTRPSGRLVRRAHDGTGGGRDWRATSQSRLRSMHAAARRRRTRGHPRAS